MSDMQAVHKSKSVVTISFNVKNRPRAVSLSGGFEAFSDRLEADLETVEYSVAQLNFLEGVRVSC